MTRDTIQPTNQEDIKHKNSPSINTKQKKIQCTGPKNSSSQSDWRRCLHSSNVLVQKQISPSIKGKSYAVCPKWKQFRFNRRGGNAPDGLFPLAENEPGRQVVKRSITQPMLTQQSPDSPKIQHQIHQKHEQWINKWFMDSRTKAQDRQLLGVIPGRWRCLRLSTVRTHSRTTRQAKKAILEGTLNPK